MRIVFLNPVGALGGGERSLLDMMASLRATEPAIEMQLICCTAGPLVEAARALGVQAQAFAMPPILARAGESRLGGPGWRRALDTSFGIAAAGFAGCRFANALRDLVLDLQPDLVHSNGMKCHLLTRMAPIPQTPLVWHMRDFVSTRPIMGRLLRYAVIDGTTIIANSRAVAEDVRAALRSKQGVTIETIHNGIDTALFSPAPTDGGLLDKLAEWPEADPGTIRVGLVATYARWKGQDLFLNAIRRIVNRNPPRPIRFYIVGGDIYETAGSQFSETELRGTARSLDVDPVVAFVPFQVEMPDVYRALDIVVHASTRPEPFGRTLVEAMACGRAVIASGEGGVGEIVTADHDGLLFEPCNVDSLAEGIIRLIENPTLRARLAAAARETACRRFDRRRLGEQLLGVYRRLLRH